jgi:hypothetical protein
VAARKVVQVNTAPAGMSGSDSSRPMMMPTLSALTSVVGLMKALARWAAGSAETVRITRLAQSKLSGPANSWLSSIVSVGPSPRPLPLSSCPRAAVRRSAS